MCCVLSGFHAESSPESEPGKRPRCEEDRKEGKYTCGVSRERAASAGTQVAHPAWLTGHPGVTVDIFAEFPDFVIISPDGEIF